MTPVGHHAKPRTLGIHPSLSHGCRAQGLQLSSATFPGIIAGTWLEVEHLGLEPTVMWDADITGGGLNSLLHNARPELVILVQNEIIPS